MRGRKLLVRMALLASVAVTLSACSNLPVSVAPFASAAPGETGYTVCTSGRASRLGALHNTGRICRQNSSLQDVVWVNR